MNKWPLAKNNCRFLKYTDEIFATLSHEATLQKSYVKVLHEVERSCSEKGDYKTTEVQINKLLNDFGESSDDASLITNQETVLVGACLQFLKSNCTAEAWHHLWSLRWHSHILTEALEDAVVWLAKNDPDFRQDFTKAARQVIEDAIAEPYKRSAPRDVERFAAMRNSYLEKPSLMSLFRGLPEADGIYFHDDDGIFYIMSKVDPAELLKLILMFDNPYPMQKALEVACFDSTIWESLVSIAPDAFGNNGAWNQSPILPLLLSIANSHIKQAQHKMFNPELGEAEREIAELSNQVVQAITSRKNSAVLSKRWSTWLMREIMIQLNSHEPPMPTDARSRGYVQAILITTMGILKNTWSTALAEEVPLWEDWCFRCALALIAQQGGSPFPTAAEFVDQWSLNLDDWSQAKGKQLRERAKLFMDYPERPDSYGIRMLAVSLALSEKPHELLKQLWESTWAIRELTEFGNAALTKDVAEKGLPTPSFMMRLLFGLGLMTLDCVADDRLAIIGDRALILNKLFSTVKDIADEMSVIDRFHTDYWTTAFKHLAIRRLHWTLPSQDRTTVFDESLKPTLSDFILKFAGDTERFLELLALLVRKSPSPVAICALIKDAQIDLSQQICLGRKLISLSRRKTKLTQKDLELLEKTCLNKTDYV